LRPSLDNPELPALMSKMHHLPGPPEIYLQIVEEVQTGDASVDRIGELIIEDQALSAKLMQLANSAVFALQLQVIHPTEAVTYLGLETTKALLLLAHTFSFFEHLPESTFSPTSLQYHALTTARLAQRIASAEDGGSECALQSFSAGLLHDLGKLLLAANLPREFAQALVLSREQSRCLWEVESQLLGASHAEIGGCFLATWNLPPPIVEAVTWHHAPAQCPSASTSFSPLTAVHTANVLEHESRPEATRLPPSSLDMAYLADLACVERLPYWRQLCLQSPVEAV
jgi:HD-like signal output (HDOD) protein